jgi:hypothetical protein
MSEMDEMELRPLRYKFDLIVGDSAFGATSQQADFDTYESGSTWVDRLRSANPAIHQGHIVSLEDNSTSYKIETTIEEVLGKGSIVFTEDAVPVCNSSPCLVIQGICNSYEHFGCSYGLFGYSWWHTYYASAMAAAYAKELLGVLAPESLQAIQPVCHPISWSCTRSLDSYSLKYDFGHRLDTPGSSEYVSKLASDLFEYWSDISEYGDLNKICFSLPELLQGFAQKIGGEFELPSGRLEVMKLVHTRLR